MVSPSNKLQDFCCSCLPLMFPAGVEAAAQDGADLLLLTRELNSLLGTSSQAIVYKLSQAQCQWNFVPADRSITQPNHLPKWVPVLACLITLPVLSCLHVARGQFVRLSASWVMQLPLTVCVSVCQNSHVLYGLQLDLLETWALHVHSRHSH